jgi:hypothetical protein
MSCHARVAWRKRNIIRNKLTRAKDEQGVRRVWMLRERVQTCHEGRKGVEDLGNRRPQYLRKQDLKKLLQQSTGNVNKTLRKTIGLAFVKHPGCSVTCGK